MTYKHGVERHLEINGTSLYLLPATQDIPEEEVDEWNLTTAEGLLLGHLQADDLGDTLKFRYQAVPSQDLEERDETIQQDREGDWIDGADYAVLIQDNLR